MAPLQVLQDVRQKYKASEQSQLESVADWLLAAFRDAELPFLNILHDQPMAKARHKRDFAITRRHTTYRPASAQCRFRCL